MNEGTKILVESLSFLQKYSVYLHYRITQTAMKYDFVIVDKTPIKKDVIKWNHGWGKPDKEVHNIAFYNIWKDIRVLSFERFVSETNIRIIDNGDNWKGNGFAEKIRTDYFGIYNWIWKFPESLN